MKQLQILIMLLALVFIPACSTAAAVNVYVESMGSQGTYIEKSGGNDAVNNPLAVNFAGVELLGEEWKLGVEYGQGQYTVEAGDISYDYSQQNLKLGYQIWESPRFLADLTVSHTTVEQNNLLAGKVAATSIGADLGYRFNDQVNAELNLAYSVTCEYSEGIFPATVTVNMKAYQLKLNYLFSDNWGAYLGYRQRLLDYKQNHVRLLATEAAGTVAGLGFRF